MKKLTLAGLVAIGVVLAGALAAGAHADEPASCAAALTAFQDATKAATAAQAADKAAADAKAADDALAAAKAALVDARTAAVNGGVVSANLTAVFAAALRTERTTLLAIPADQRADAQVKRLAEIEHQLPLVDTFLAVQAKVTAATTLAEATDADALRREADKTDADALAKKAAELRAIADQACKGDPAVTVIPLPPAPQSVPVPARIDTGRAA